MTDDSNLVARLRADIARLERERDEARARREERNNEVNRIHRFLIACAEERDELREELTATREEHAAEHEHNLQLSEDLSRELHGKRIEGEKYDALVTKLRAEVAEWRRMASEEVRADVARDDQLSRALAEVTRERDEARAALREALEEWDYCAKYKGDYLAWKHEDHERIAELRKRFALEEPQP